MKSNWKRIFALVLSLALLLCAAVPAMAESAAKDETVYILSDAQGRARRIIVSDWLKNPDKLDELTDATRLQNLTVVEGNATFERDGERLTWDADGKDVYYQGDSDEELPLTLQITYLVDGEEVPAADMAGKSGRVTIRFAYTPAADQKAQFAVLSAALLDSDRFTNVEVTNGAVINDGDRLVALGAALPGLKARLDENSETLNAGALQVFQLLLQTANQQLKALNPQVPDLTVETYAEVLDGLTQQMTAAKQTKTEAFQSLQVLKAQLDSYNQFYTGLTAYTAGVDQLSANMPALTDGATALNDGAAQLYAGLQTLDQDGLQTLTSMVNDEWKPLFENARALADDTEAYQSYAGKADDAEGVVRFIWRTDAIGD